jgi:hypothetical protein
MEWPDVKMPVGWPKTNDGREYMQQMMARMDANQAKADKNLREIRKEIQSGQAEMRSRVNAWREEMMGCEGKMEAHLECEEPTSVDMEPEAAHWEIHKEGAAGMPVGGLRKRRWD